MASLFPFHGNTIIELIRHDPVHERCVMGENETSEILTEKTRRILFGISCISLIGAIILIVLTTSPIEDSIFFFSEIQIQFILADFATLFFGFIGFLYYFILPGLAYLLTLNPFGLALTTKRLILILMYSSTGNYFGLLFGMFIQAPVLGLILPLFLFFLMFIGVSVLNLIEQPKKPIVIFKIAKPHVSKKLGLFSLLGILVISLSIIIRLIMFNANVIEYSDVLDYDHQIVSIAINDFLQNPNFAARAPLYAMYAYLFGLFVPTPLASLKVISFMFSFLLLIPAYSIVSSLRKNQDSTVTHQYVLILLLIYPWTMLMASVALQDTLLTFYVMAFIALILKEGKVLTIASSFAAGLAFLCRYSLGILGPLGFVYIIYRNRKEGIKSSILFIVFWAISAGSWIIRNMLVAGVPFSTTDEGMFDISHFIPGLINIAKEIGLDRIGMNSLAFWIPVVIIGLLFIRSTSGRNKIKQFFSRDYIFIYLIMILQILTIATFRTQQYRFLLSVIWFIPLIWVLVIEGFEIPGKRLLTLGWILFSISHAFNLNRIYWVFDQSRLPEGRYPFDYNVIQTIMPTITNWINVVLAIGVACMLTILLKIAIPLQSKKSDPSSIDKNVS